MVEYSSAASPAPTLALSEEDKNEISRKTAELVLSASKQRHEELVNLSEKGITLGERTVELGEKNLTVGVQSLLAAREAVKESKAGREATVASGAALFHTLVSGLKESADRDDEAKAQGNLVLQELTSVKQLVVNLNTTLETSFKEVFAVLEVTDSVKQEVFAWLEEARGTSGVASASCTLNTADESADDSSETSADPLPSPADPLPSADDSSAVPSSRDSEPLHDVNDKKPANKGKGKEKAQVKAAPSSKSTSQYSSLMEAAQNPEASLAVMADPTKLSNFEVCVKKPTCRRH